MNVTNDDYLVLKQPIQERYMRIDIIDFGYNIVDEISGVVTAFSVNINASSDIRRTCSSTIVVTDSSFDIKAGGRVWLDKFIQPYIGIRNILTGEIVWKNQGTYLINAPSWSYSADTNTLSFSGVDLCAKLTGLRNGQLEGIPHTISSGSNVRSAIISTLALAGFTKYVVSECSNRNGVVQNVPYDIEISAGGTVWDILAALRDILPMYQMFFDADGVFHYEPIPSGDNEPVVLDDDLLPYVLTAEKIDTDFESVKNYVEVYGKTHDVTHYPTATSESGGVIALTIPSLTSAPTAGDMIGFTLDAAISTAASINVNSTGAHNLVDSSGTQISALDANTYYVAIYQSGDTWLFLGHLQAQAVWSDTNVESPFYINGTTGKIRYVCSGGEYENIQSDELALERAKLEIYWRCRLNDKISLTTIPIPWMDVNVLISHAIKGGNTQVKYMVDSISADYSENGTMTITAHTYYPYYAPY